MRDPPGSASVAGRSEDGDGMTEATRNEEKHPRSRVRQALVCPYCRDDVGRSGTVACARRGCGALYHRGCWEECAASYGGCAIYGCESKRSREVSVAGFLLRVVRLAVAALLFSPRVLRTVVDPRRAETRSVIRQALSVGWSVSPFSERIENGTFKMSLYLAGAVPSVLLAAILYDRYNMKPGMVVMWSMPLIPIVAGTILALAFLSLKAFASVLRGELANLGRVDEGGDTVLGRLRAGPPKK